MIFVMIFVMIFSPIELRPLITNDNGDPTTFEQRREASRNSSAAPFRLPSWPIRAAGRRKADKIEGLD